MKKVLVKEDQQYIREFIADALRRNGYEPVDELSDNVEAAVLDSQLADMDSYELCQTIREKNPKAAILMLSSAGEAFDQLTGFMTGADDYVIRPFSTATLLNHLEAALCRVRLESVRLEELVSFGPFILDTGNQTLEKVGEPIRLTRREYLLLKTLMEAPGHEYSREELMEIIEGDSNQLDLCIRCLRIKLEEDPNQPEYIITVWGHGYKWCG